MENKTVKIYTSPTCQYCKMAKNYFEKHDIDYEEYDVTEDEERKEEMVEKSHQMGVPVIEIGKDIYVGFHRKEIAKKLGLEEQKHR